MRGRLFSSTQDWEKKHEGEERKRRRGRDGEG